MVQKISNITKFFISKQYEEKVWWLNFSLILVMTYFLLETIGAILIMISI